MLTALVFLSALVLLISSDAWMVGWYVEYLLSMGAVLLGASLIGPLLLEDVLRKIG